MLLKFYEGGVSLNEIKRTSFYEIQLLSKEAERLAAEIKRAAENK